MLGTAFRFPGRFGRSIGGADHSGPRRNGGGTSTRSFRGSQQRMVIVVAFACDPGSCSTASRDGRWRWGRRSLRRPTLADIARLFVAVFRIGNAIAGTHPATRRLRIRRWLFVITCVRFQTVFASAPFSLGPAGVSAGGSGRFLFVIRIRNDPCVLRTRHMIAVIRLVPLVPFQTSSSAAWTLACFVFFAVAFGVVLSTSQRGSSTTATTCCCATTLWFIALPLPGGVALFSRRYVSIDSEVQPRGPRHFHGSGGWSIPQPMRLRLPGR